MEQHNWHVYTRAAHYACKEHLFNVEYQAMGMYVATDKNWDLGMPVGCGTSPIEAMRDLIGQMEEV